MSERNKKQKLDPGEGSSGAGKKGNLRVKDAEVVDKGADSVLDEIEATVLEISASILEGNGFSFDIPSRAKGNQMYVPELDRIVLKDSISKRPFSSTQTCRKTAITTRILGLVHQLCTKQIHVTKRDLFYTDVKLFEDQSQSDSILDDMACMLGCTRSSLHVVASEKGVVVGRLTFREAGDQIDCQRMGVGGKAIPPNVDKVDSIQSDALFILLVEKDAAFMRLAEDRFYNTYPCIILTAKGQPDVATRLFLRKLKTTLKIPVLALVDSDPYGLKILSVYMKGSMNMSYDSSNLTTPDIKWLGVRPSDLDRFNIPQQCRLPMTEEDIKTGKKLLEEDFVKANPLWVAELELMLKTKEKAEIQALSSFGFQYLSQFPANPYLSTTSETCQGSQYGCINNFWCDPAFGLADAGFGYCFLEAAEGDLCIVQESNLAWLHSHGTEGQRLGATVMQWTAFVLCVLILMFYTYHYWKATTGWEEVYVCLVELVKVLIEIYLEYESPSALYLSTGNWILWLRYAEWLFTCPVILIHLSNLTGLKDDYSKRTMRLLVSDIGCVVWGVSAALTTGYLKWIFFLFGMLYGFNTYFHSAKVYIESYHTVPKGHCRLVVRCMALFFYSAWTMYPLLFALGPEGLGLMNSYTSTITTSFADIMTKQLWGLLGHHLRVKIFEHILIHGDIRKTTTMQVAGEELQVETFVEEEDEDTVKHSTKELANRASFVAMARDLKQKGVDVRMSMDPGEEDVEGGQPGGLEPGRVILAVVDMSMVDYFRMQFSHLSPPIELVPALGVDNTLQLVQQAASMGGCDCVILHPELLQDRSPNGLVAKLRMMGQRVAAFGWTQSMSPVRTLIETSGLDGWLEGPTFGSGITTHALWQLVHRMQSLRKQQQMNMLVGGGGMGGMGMMGMQTNPMMMHQQTMGMPASAGGMNPMMMQKQMNQVTGVNPLFGSAPTPLGSNTGMYGNGASPLGSQAGGNGAAAVNGNNDNFYGQAAAGTMSGANTPTATSASMNEAEMLQQLMGEINRLKSELAVPGPTGR
ncbi:hypothetical protein CEUSTIGMA_g10038.t1 [Chlamydomonas eustigma]|uniref:DNA topoisomerase (ATP-hydrolyzing) n=1 Tax=Chlamydomonas eustigma TaxID=1157962 RepID=A0A250XI73_9CHLO|nr:hypothetical protein CEUSTIGMA_g10038.t1 [Chlamydomonas eustigma]|eukprot:GAX82612.1 hypothetical protein CEUSTIGMA_g10038.t1 [Chlamydomonas eustigma]